MDPIDFENSRRRHNELLDEFRSVRASIRERRIFLEVFFGALAAGIALHYLIRFLP